MTPQETQLVNDLFDRLAQLESVPRDPTAERLIADGLQRAPHAVYALVQTALVQDEALKRANARIEELQAQMSGAQAAEQEPPSSFLDGVREAFGGRAPERGSVPSVRPATPGYASDYQPQGSQSQGSQSQGSQWQGSQSPGLQPQNFEPQGNQPQPGYPPPLPPSGYPSSGYPGGAPLGSGGSFFGAAASAAAGMIGGALLLNGIRSMFGHHLGGSGTALGGSTEDRSSPWSNAADHGAANSDLARDLGANQIGSRDDNAGGKANNADAFASTNDDYDENADDSDDADDNEDTGDGDFDGGDSDSDSYDV